MPGPGAVKDTPEIRALKATLRERGINFHPRHGEAKLRALLEGRETYEKKVLNPYEATQKKYGQTPQEAHAQKIEAKAEPQSEIGLHPFTPHPQTPPQPEPVAQAPSPAAQPVFETPKNGRLYLTEKEYQDKQFAEKKRKANRLVRIRLTCMNPNKKNFTGEIISVGSSKLGEFKKFVPFNSEEPYHVPEIIYKELKNRKCRINQVVKLPNGQEVNRYKLINEFAIEVLPPLTPEEIKDLAQRQAMAGGVS
jgi:hypothetical protein